jgi:hypothetical protein
MLMIAFQSTKERIAIAYGRLSPEKFAPKLSEK